MFLKMNKQVRKKKDRASVKKEDDSDDDGKPVPNDISFISPIDGKEINVGRKATNINSTIALSVSDQGTQLIKSSTSR
jgi:hypothetical protein